ncbi:MAG: hypothetical protein RLZZ127_442, partial [Planctomycetota bacterium]
MRLLAVFALLIASTTWGIAFPPLKALLDDAGSGHAAWWTTLAVHVLRFAAAGALLALLTALWRRRGPTSREWELGAVLAVVVGTGMVLQIDALHRTGAAVTGFLTQAYVVWVPLAVAVMARRLPGAAQLAAAAMVVAGAALLSRIHPGDLRLGAGEIEVLAASLCFAAQILILERPRYAACDGLQVTWVMLLGMAAAALPAVLAGGAGAGGLAGVAVDGQRLALLGAIAVVSTALPFWLVNAWQRHLPAPVASVLYTVEAPAAAAAAATLPPLLS